DFVVANLYTWLRLRKGRQRGGNRDQRRKTSLERAAAVEHGRSPSREDNSFDPTKKILSQKTKIHSKKFRDVSGPRVFLGWPARTRRVRTRRRKQSDGHCEHQIRCHLCLGPLKLSRELPHCRRRGRPRPGMTTHMGEAVRDRRNSPFCDMTGRKME